MIEELRKDIKRNAVVIEDYYDDRTEVICVDVLFQILEKHFNKLDNYRKAMYKASIPLKEVSNEDVENMPTYMDLSKYKKAWEELKEHFYKVNIEVDSSCYYTELRLIEKLETEHGIEVN